MGECRQNLSSSCGWDPGSFHGNRQRMLRGQQQLCRPRLLALVRAPRHQAQLEGSLQWVQGLGKGILQGSQNRPEPEEASSFPKAMQRVGVQRGL